MRTDIKIGTATACAAPHVQRFIAEGGVQATPALAAGLWFCDNFSAMRPTTRFLYMSLTVTCANRGSVLNADARRAANNECPPKSEKKSVSRRMGWSGNSLP